MKQLITEWKKSFDEAVACIENTIKPQAHDDSQTTQFRQLAQWMLETEHSPYDYMTLGHQCFKSNPYTTEYSLNMLHHALLDDGDVSFVTFKVEGKTEKVFIMFADNYADYFDKLCREDNQGAINSFINGREFNIRIMNKMKENYPDRKITSSSPLKDSDFTFEAHREPLLFIKQFENLQLEKAERNKKSNEQMAKLRKTLL